MSIAFGLLCSLTLVGSCKSDEDDGSEYRDNRGRVCSVPLGVYNPKADCNRTSRPVEGCAAGTPCFTLNPLLDTGQMRNCDTCCVNDYPALPDYRDCALVTCRSNADCVYTNAHCVNSFCFFLPQAGAGGGGGASGAGASGAPVTSGAGGSGIAGSMQSVGGAGAGSMVAGSGGSLGGRPPFAAGGAAVSGAGSGAAGATGGGAGTSGRSGF